MATASQVRLLIADASENRAHELDSSLRNAGLLTRPKVCTDTDRLYSALEQHSFDVLLCHEDFSDLQTLLSNLQKQSPDLPVLVLAETNDCNLIAPALALGAADLICEQDHERLLHVIRRELNHVCQARQLVKTRRALAEAERRCELLLANTTTAIAYVHEGMHIHANQDYVELFGFSEQDDLIGLSLLDLVDASCADELKSAVKTFRANEQDLNKEIIGRHTDGHNMPLQISLSAADYEGEHCMQVMIRAQAGAAVATAAVPPAEDSTEQADVASNGTAAAEANPAEANPAEPSAAPTKANGGSRPGGEAFVACLQASPDSLAAIVLASVDDFAALQAEHGFALSQQLLDDITECLHAVAPKAVINRISVEIFAIGITAASAAGSDMVAEDMRRAVEDCMFEIGGRTVRCTLTLGAINVSDPNNAAQAIELAFRAMMQGRAGKAENQVHWYSAAAQIDSDGGPGSSANGENQAIADQIRQALEKQRFLLLFQPIISLRGDSDEHYEVFLRMIDEEGEQIAPGAFLPAAIEHGIAGKIDRWVILQSIKLLSTHRSKGHNTRLTVNLTQNSLLDEEFVQWLGVAIKAARLPSDAVIFQITEKDAAAYLRQAKAFVNGLRAMHCRVALSQFGIGKNAFDTLKHVPVDFIKLDGSLVQKIDADSEKRNAFTDKIRELQGMGKMTIVPMVESATVLSALWQAGANYIQGHYLQEPTAEMNYDFAGDD